MKMIYSDGPDNISYTHWGRIPGKTVAKGRLNLAALSLYGFYRAAIYSSYSKNPDLAEDIRTRKKAFTEREGSILSQGRYTEPLDHYCVEAAIGAVREWKDRAENMHSYMAYEEGEREKRRVGFVHFNEKTVRGKTVVYIAQAGVQPRGAGIGRHLMECVLSHYPAGTEFYILTRIFNSEAKNLYGRRLGFTPIEEGEIRELGYDARYCGFKHTTTPAEVDEIKTRQRTLVASDEVDCGAAAAVPRC